ncbi:MAG: MGMT family protein [Candidatus Asgardarchaeia archaeon]
MGIIYSKKELTYRILKRLPKGKITTYGDLAKALGTSPRAIGVFMKKNTDPDVIPCFKVVRSDGTIGGYSLGENEKIKRLEREGIKVDKHTLKIKDFQRHRVSIDFLKSVLIELQQK